MSWPRVVRAQSLSQVIAATDTYSQNSYKQDFLFGKNHVAAMTHFNEDTYC
jgi:hypothetical protein